MKDNYWVIVFLFGILSLWYISNKTIDNQSQELWDKIGWCRLLCEDVIDSKYKDEHYENCHNECMWELDSTDTTKVKDFKSLYKWLGADW